MAKIFVAPFDGIPPRFRGTARVFATPGQQPKEYSMPHDNEAAGDLILGGSSITLFVNSLLDPATPITESQFYGWVERNHIPVSRIGSRIIASKRRLRAYLSGDAP